MAEKQKTGDSGVGNSRNPGPEGVDPEDDVTSDIAGIVDAAFADDGLIAQDEIRITDAQLAAYVDPETDNPLESGTLLNARFEIVELVHSGGMGHVYKAIDRRRHTDGSDDVHVAIKMLRESLADREDLRMMLQREATKAQFLSHPNIINIFDFDEHEGRFFLIMEWLEGESVNALLRRTSGQRLSPAFAWAVIEGAAEAIRHAHLNNVVHADINPSNIFITTTQDIKLLDFGVARYANDLHDPAEDEVAWVTQTYASPEILSGEQPVFQDDVFSLGCVAYRLLGGKHPFAGSTSIVAQRGDVAIDPIPGLPESDWQVLEQALAYSRSGRPDTVAVFLRSHAPFAAADNDESRRSANWLRWGLPVAAAAVAAVAVGLWPRDEAPDTAAIPAVTQDVVGEVVQDAVPAAAAVEAAASPVAAIIGAADQAIAEQRLILPEGNNARESYREALTIEPENPEALRGLRTISDVFVGRADAALKAGNPRAAMSALGIASETDAGNPAIAIVTALLVAQGDAQLTAARIAAATGNVDEAEAALAQAEQYAHIDPASIGAIREQLAGLELDAAFSASLAVADEHLAAGRLLEPEGGNAREVLARLSETYASDPRLLAASERLAQRLLTRAAVAMTSGNLAEAAALIDAADSLGVLPADVATARESVATATRSQQAQAEAQRAAPAVVVPDVVAVDAEAAEAGSASADASVPTDDTATPIGVAGEPGLVSEPLVPTSAPVTGTGVAASGADTGTDSSEVATVPTAGSASIRRNLNDLGLQRFIAPTYPRSARRRGLTGYVELVFDVNPDGRTSGIEVIRGVPEEVFDESAADAVRQWRFASQEEPVRAGVTLRFEVAD